MLHKLVDNQPYYIGFFLAGAYQGTMGNLHNLFGRINEAHVYLDKNEQKGWYIENIVKGDTVADVLSYNDYSKTEVIKKMKKQIDYAIKNNIVRPGEGIKILTEFEAELSNYTYLETMIL